MNTLAKKGEIQSPDPTGEQTVKEGLLPKLNEMGIEKAIFNIDFIERKIIH